jgi:hypothetical protein
MNRQSCLGGITLRKLKFRKKKVCTQEIDVLKLDKDCMASKEWLDALVNVVILPVCAHYGVEVQSVKVCRSMIKGQHLYIEVNPSVDSMTANAIQYLCGDDTLRVAFNLARIRAGLVNLNKLFEPAGTKLTTVYRRPKE